jgi:hypothetical protein
MSSCVEWKRKSNMNCEEFELLGLGLDRESVDGDEGAQHLKAASDHVNACSRCAALQESWREAQQQLAALREATENASAPLRVEMRLRQEFHTRHRTLKVRAAAVVMAWALAGAAVLVGAVSWWNWHVARTGSAAGVAQIEHSSSTTAASNDSASTANNASDASGENLIASNDAEDFTLLPGSLPQEIGDAAVVRVRMQRGALGALGLPVNETRANEWIQVDLFVGQDGQPQAVRLPQE